MRRKISKPYPYSITPCGYTITYKCRECGQEFPMRNDKYHYCYKCGVKLDWGVVLKANAEWKGKFSEVVRGEMLPDGHFDYTERDKMLEDLDKVNQTIEDGVPREMEYTENTRRAVIKSNINYYLGQGWTREELINKRFFSEEDFRIYEDTAEA